MLLHWAALAGREQLVDYILKTTDGEGFDHPDDTNATPLILATLGGHLGIVQILIQKGANINHKKEGGHTSLQYACSKGYKSIVEYLIEKKADVNVLDDRMESCLHRLATQGRDVIMKILLNKGASIDLQNKEGNLFFFYILVCNFFYVLCCRKHCITSGL